MLTLDTDFVFYHVPKCAGTSIREMLYKLFVTKYTNDQIYIPSGIDNFPQAGTLNGINYHGINLTSVYQLDRIKRTLSEDNLQNIKVILCHVHKELHLHCGDNTRSMFIVRDPVDRLISHWNHFMHQEKGMCKVEELSQDELTDYCMQYSELYQKYLGCPGKCKWDRIKQSIDNMTYVSTLESLNSTFPVILRRIIDDFSLNVNIDDFELPRKNVRASTIDPDLRVRIYDIISNQTNFQIYNYIKYKFI